MVINAKNSNKAHIQKDVSSLQARYARMTSDLSLDDLKKVEESAIQSIGAFRHSLKRIDTLSGYRVLFRDLLKDCRIIVDAHGHKSLVKKIDKALKDTDE